MQSTATFIDLIRSINSGNATGRLETLASLLRTTPPAELGAASILRHLKALGFRLEGGARYRDAARAYELAASVDPRDPKSWRMLAAGVRLRDCIERELWDAASAFIAEIRLNGAEGAIREHAATLLRIGWDHECCYRAEPAVQCYRLALAINAGDDGFATGDGQSISLKIRNLRLLQMNALADQGRHEEAAALHESTRTIAGLGPLGIYDIISAKQAADDGQGVYRELLAGRRMAEPDVKVLDGPVAMTSQPGILDAPPQYFALLKDCLTFPRSNVVVHGRRLIYDLGAHPLSGLADIKDGVNPDQIMTIVWGAGRALVEAPAATREIEAGLMLFGLQSRNYGHWLLEFVGRMLCFNDRACPAGFPICIDDDMPETHRQIVELMDDRDRPIVTLPPVATNFRELGMAPVPTFFPFDTRPELPIYDAIWPKDILAAVKCRIMQRLASRGVDLRRTGRRIVLSRRGFAQRQLLNETEIVDTLVQRGFEVVHPETLTFAEQIATYHAADIIVGSASSALTNCIFCRPGAKVVALIHQDLSFNFRGYTSMIESSGAELLFVRGITEHGAAGHPFHVNYTVQPDQVLRAIARMTGQAR